MNQEMVQGIIRATCLDHCRIKRHGGNVIARSVIEFAKDFIWDGEILQNRKNHVG